MWYNAGMGKLIELNDGLRLVVCENPAVRSVSAGIFVAAGAVNETPEEAGISHFIEHMVFKGTRRRSVFDVVNDIDSVGAQINAYTSRAHTCYHTVSRDAHAAECLDVLADIYLDPLFDEDALERERNVVIEEINEAEDTPDDLCVDRLFSAFFKGHPLGNNILGTKKSLAALTSDSLRAYRRKFYTPARTVVSVAGNITAEQAEELVKEKFASFSGESLPRVPLPPARHALGAFTRRKKDIEQVHIALAFPGVAYGSKLHMAANIVSSAFASEMSSRLFQTVREKLGLCYGIYGYLSAYENNGAYVIATSISPANAERAAEAIRDEIRLLLKEGLTPAELEKGREQLKTALVLGQEKTSVTMMAQGRHALMTGELYDIDARLAELDRVTAEDAREAAETMFRPHRAAVSVVGRDPADISSVIRG